ncbi:MAG: TonB family protein [Thalassotalea sp.]|nr:TonB family protein [Thalassotalea sp.]
MQEFITSSPVLHALAVTLIHFVWQGLVIAAVVKILLSLIDRKLPVIRYTITSIGMVISLLVPVATFSYLYKPLVSQDVSQLGLMALDPITAALNRTSTLDWYQSSGDLLPYLSLIWLAWVSFLTVRLILDIARVQRLPFSQVIPTEPALQQKFEQLVKQIGLNKLPKLVVSLSAEVPMAIGWLKPVVLMPAKMILGLNQAQLEMLLLHELAHIKRYDYLVNFLQTFVEILLFFHPAVLWISKQMRQEREYCSDDIAVAHCGNPIAYAHTLADTAELSGSHRHATIPTMAMAASGGDLKDRVYRLVNHSCTNSANPDKWLVGITLTIGLTLGVTTLSTKQLSVLPFFDLTSVGINFFSAKSSTVSLTQLNEQSSTPAEFSIAQQLLKPKSANTNSANTVLGALSGDISLQNDPQTLSTAERFKEPQNNLLGVNKSLNNVNQHMLEIQIVSDNAEQMPQGSSTKPSNVQPSIGIKSTKEPYLARVQASPSVDKRSGTNDFQTPQVKNSELVNTNAERDTLAQNKLLETYTSATGNNPYAKELESLSQPSSESNIVASKLNASEISKGKINTPKEALHAQLFEQSDDEIVVSRVEELLAKRTAKKPVFESVQEVALFEQHYNSSLSNRVVKRNANLTYGEYPKYPSVAKRKGIELEVFVSFTIDEEGRVSNIQFEKQSKLNYFKSSINTALRKWRFEPALEDGQPVQSTMSKIFSFNLS